MYSVRREIHFCYGHRLVGHPGKCRHLHGHNARAVVTVCSPVLDALGMVVDFAEIDRRVRAFIDQELDHTLLLAPDDPVLGRLRDAGERVYVMDAPPTAENIARLIFERARASGLDVAEVAMWEAEGSVATYRPETR